MHPSSTSPPKNKEFSSDSGMRSRDLKESLKHYRSPTDKNTVSPISVKLSKGKKNLFLQTKLQTVAHDNSKERRSLTSKLQAVEHKGL